MKKEDTSLLSKTDQNAIDHWVAKFPEDQAQSALLAALTLVQKNHGGFLTRELMDAVAAYLEIAPMAVYEVANFYSMYELHPVGKHKVSFCQGLSCMLRGADERVAQAEKILGACMGDTTADGAISLRRVECLGACVAAPVMQVDGRYVEEVSESSLAALLKDVCQKESAS